jgi:hypothetical protein
MRNRRRRYLRKNGTAAGKWVLLCCIIIAIAVTVNILVPDIKSKVQSAMTPVYERSQQYKAVFARFGEALSGDHSFIDAFTGIFSQGKKN